MFSNKINLNKMIKIYKLENFVTAINNVSASANNKYMKLVFSQYINIITFIFSILLLVLCSFIMAYVYCDNNKQKIFTKYICGFPIIKMYWRFMLEKLFINIILLILSIYLFHFQNNLIFMFSIIVITLNILVLYLFSIYNTKRIKSNTIKRY
jgi:hypothetical protein